MKLALYQGPSLQGDQDKTIAKIRQMASASHASGASMVVFPELFLSGYNQPNLFANLAQPAGGDWEQEIANIAMETGCGVTFGWPERDGDNLYNTATAIDGNGQVLARYRKIQLFGDMERSAFEPGSEYVSFDLEGIPTALLICYDIEFPEHARALAEKGVELILVPTANGTDFPDVSTIFVPARALENGICVAYANYCGSENGLTFCGYSTVVSPNGKAAAIAGTGETLLTSEFTSRSSYPASQVSAQHKDLRKLNAS